MLRKKELKAVVENQIMLNSLHKIIKKENQSIDWFFS